MKVQNCVKDLHIFNTDCCEALGYDWAQNYYIVVTTCTACNYYIRCFSTNLNIKERCLGFHAKKAWLSNLQKNFAKWSKGLQLISL